MTAPLLMASLPLFHLVTTATGHDDPVARVALALAAVLVLAKLGGDLAQRVGQPAVLGELMAGVLLGNLDLVGISFVEPLGQDPFLDLLAQLGVLMLLFEIGLESTVAQMLKVGVSSLLVATLGVMAPFGLGWAASALLLPDALPPVHAFVGATLCATSVGITARVLQDLGRSQTGEARVILGAAVIDDVLGLVILALVTGIIAAQDAGTALSPGVFGLITAKAAAFLVGSLALGVVLSRRLFKLASRLKPRGVLLALGLACCFFLAWLASAIGLAPIIGAFAAGLILEDVHYKDYVDRGEHGLDELIKPIASFLVPIFFVLMGLRTDLRALASTETLTLAAVLTVVAIASKQVAGLGVLGKGMSRLTVGIGMVPRGEVGLIFASIGASLTLHGKPVVDATLYSAIVAMVIITTMVTPPLLKWSMERRSPQ